MFYQKPGSFVIIGIATISDHLVSEYVGTLCFSVDKSEYKDKFAQNEFFDVCLTREQLLQLHQAISEHLKIQSEYPLVNDRFS